MNYILPVVLCGGSGSRLWPLSRSGFPKQFLSLSEDSKNSLFQDSITRIYEASDSNDHLFPILIVTNEEHRFLVLEQLRELNHKKVTLLLEPVARNTAPALTLAAFHALSEGVDPILAVIPADQKIKDKNAFNKAWKQAIDIAGNGEIVIFGVPPTRPETAYGYIKASETSGGQIGGIHVERFEEKPCALLAEKFIKEGGYFWNGGMFFLKASVWIEALKEFRPDIFVETKKAWDARINDGAQEAVFIRPSKEFFSAIPAESIDYSVIERCPGSKFSISMVKLDAGWSDLGSWDAVWECRKSDANGNVVVGDVVLVDSKENLVHSSGRLVGVLGVEGLVIIETPDAVLVANREKSQQVKTVVSQLTSENRGEKNLHRKVMRPWGWYDTIDEGRNFKVKRILVNPGESLSLQLHKHRAEHWIVVKGVAEVTNGNKTLQLNQDQSTFIPKGQIHRLANKNNVELEIIEVQSGEYLGEDDITRLADFYGRGEAAV